MRSLCPAPVRLALALLLLAAVLLPLSACGRKAAPEPPPDSDFPRTYPKS